MDILKAFSLYDKEYSINIQCSIENPLFQANQIGKLLEIAKIRNHMINFDENDKVAHESSTLGGIQKVLFLTDGKVNKYWENFRSMCRNNIVLWSPNNINDNLFKDVFNKLHKQIN